MQIQITNLSKQYGKVHALNNVSFQLPEHYVAGLVGPNGAGKTTLLKLLAARELPDSGEILYNQQNLLDHPQELLPLVGLMPDSLPAVSTWTVGPYLDFFTRANNLKGQARQDKLDQNIRLLKLEGFLDRKLSALSKGMQQRVSLARILMASPQLLLLDEPSAGLDPTARIELRNCLQNLALQGINIIISSHILSDLEDFCNSLIILEQGNLRWAGSLADWKNSHNNMAVRLQLDFTVIPVNLKEQLSTLPNFRQLTQSSPKSAQITLQNTNSPDDFLSALFQLHLPICAMRILNNSVEEIFKINTQGNLQ